MLDAVQERDRPASTVIPMISSSSLAVKPATRVQGSLTVPGDKSISHRYALLGAIAEGTTSVTNLSGGADVAATLRCLETLGVRLTTHGSGTVSIQGRGVAGLDAPGRPLDAANSGTLMRLLAGLLAGSPFESTLTGDASLRSRPMRRVIEPLTAMGARIRSQDGCAPLVVAGGDLQAVTWTPAVPSAQVKSAILLAGLSARGTTVVHEPAPTRDHTERAFEVFGLATNRDGSSVSVAGGQQARAPEARLRVPGDPSAAAVWAAAASAIPGSEVRIRDVGLNPLRTGFLEVLTRMGAALSVEGLHQSGGEPVGDLRVAYGSRRPTVIIPAEVPGVIDELPVLAASAALGGGLEVSGAAELRVKESDRITALVAGLKALGVAAEERDDGFVIDGTPSPTGGTADAVGDHRLVMAFALVALGASGPSLIKGADSVAVSYPDFERDVAALAR